MAIKDVVRHGYSATISSVVTRGYGNFGLGGGGGSTTARHRNAFRVVKSLRVKLIGR